MEPRVSRFITQASTKVGARILRGWRTITRSPLFMVVVIGLLLRICLAIYSSEGDLSDFAETSSAMLFGGGPYANINVYPPDWAYLLNLVGRFDSLLQPGGNILSTSGAFVTSQWWFPLQPNAVVSPTYSLVEKAPLWLFDLGSGLLIYHLARLRPIGNVKPATLFTLWFLNPVVVLGSAVHGDYDVIPVFFILAAIVLSMERSYGFAGLSTGLAVTLKVFPLFLTPLFLVAIWKQERRRKDIAGRSMVMFSAGIALASLIVFWPPGVVQQYLLYSGTGPGVGLNFGGFWIWSLTYLPRYIPIQSWLFRNSFAVFDVCTFLAVAFCLLIATAFARQREAAPFGADFLAASVLAFSAIYLETPTVQVQYIAWILPYFLLLGAVDRRYLFAFIPVTILPSAFYLVGLGGPAYLFEGLAIYTHSVSPSAVLASVKFFFPLETTVVDFTAIPTFAALTYAMLISLPRRNRLGGSQ